MSAFPRSGETFGRYTILEELGRGGMGVVLRARQVDLDREVALKLLPAELGSRDEFVARFRHEAGTLAAVDSPHIIAIFDHGEHDGRLFIATQLVRGGDLARHLREKGPMPLDDALAVTAQLASALADAHDVGVIHRDVKPGNVLMRRVDSGWHTYLCDFGIAHTGQQELTSAGVVVGTFSYLAPERCEGEPATASSDVYALGCLLVALLTGSAPYAGSDFQVAHQHVSAPIPRWDETFHGAAQLNRILERSMAKRPDDRYPSARDMRRDLLALSDFLRSSRTTPQTLADRTVLRPQAAEPTAASTKRSIPTEARRSTGRAVGILALVAVMLTALGLGGFVAMRETGGQPVASGAGRASTPSASPSASKTVAAPRQSQRTSPQPPPPTVTVTTSTAPSPAPTSFAHGTLPCEDGGFVIALTGGLSSSSTFEDVSASMSRYPNVDGMKPRFATTEEACPSLGQAAADSGLTLPRWYPYLGPYPNAPAACRARLGTDRSTYVTQLSYDAPTPVMCPCQLELSELPGLDTTHDSNPSPAHRVWVAGLQHLLNRLGERPDSLVPGLNADDTRTGYFKTLTVRWVRQFQAAYGLDVTGVADTHTWATLRDAVCT